MPWRTETDRHGVMSHPETLSPSSAIIAAGAVDASKVYGLGESQVRALDAVTISFETGRFTAIMGPSGSGKSTLLHCLAGLDSLTSGAVHIGDTYLDSLNDKAITELRRTQVGFVFQAFNLVPTLTAQENIVLPMMLGGDTGDTAWIDEVIDTVGLRDRL
jgi:putative ABC transport system ATP-binding protein